MKFRNNILLEKNWHDRENNRYGCIYLLKDAARAYYSRHSMCTQIS